MAAPEFAELAEWACSVRGDDIPDRVLAAARSQCLSVVASIYSGAACAPGRACQQAALALRSEGSATLLPSGHRVGAMAAVLANSAFSMAHDFDDYMFLGHTGHSAVLASMAVGEQTGASIQDVLVAQVVANELAGRLGAFVAIGPQNGQMWSHIHLAGAAIAAARLYGLSAAQAADAMSIAFYMPPYALFPGFFGSDAKLLTAALPTAIGLYAAALAANGMRGAADILHHRQGFGARFAFVPLAELLSGLGSAWVTESVSCKIYPGCAYIDGPVDAALAASGGEPIAAAAVDRVDIAATALTAGMERLGESAAPPSSLEPISINFSARRSVALALMRGGLTPAQVEAAVDDAAAVRTLASRTRLRESADLTARMFEGLSRAVPLPSLAWHVGLDRLWSARHSIRGAYGSVVQPASGERRHRRLNLHRVRNGARLALGAARVLARGRQPFDMEAADFGRLEFRFAAEVAVHLRSGRVLYGTVDIPFGAAGRPAAEQRALMLRKLAAEIGADDAEAVAAMLERAGADAPVSALTAKLIREPRIETAQSSAT